METVKRLDPNALLGGRKDKPNGRYKNRLTGLYLNPTTAVKLFFDRRFSNEEDSFDKKDAHPDWDDAIYNQFVRA